MIERREGKGDNDVCRVMSTSFSPMLLLVLVLVLLAVAVMSLFPPPFFFLPHLSSY